MQRQEFASLIRFSRVLSLSLLVVLLGGLLKPEAAVQPVSFGAKTDFSRGSFPESVAVGEFNGDGKPDVAAANRDNKGVGHGAPNNSATASTDTQFSQQGPKLVGTSAMMGNVIQGESVSLSADGNTAIVGGGGDDSNDGAAWVFTAPAATAQELNWVLKSPSNVPPPRDGHAMAYDAARGQVVLFGGSGTSLRNDTWVWDGTNWTQKSPANSPTPRLQQAMAYDAARGQVVLFGGWNGVILNDTWVWDGTNWTQKSPANAPPAREFHQMAYDAARGHVVLFGGSDNANGVFNDTWVWDGTNWTQKSPANAPSARASHQMVYDAARGQVVLFGGVDNINILNDVWVWDGTNWTQKSPANSLTPPRQHYAMAYDAARGQVVLFGGWRGAPGSSLNDTWVWDGTNWTQKSPANAPASAPGAPDGLRRGSGAGGLVRRLDRRGYLQRHVGLHGNGNCLSRNLSGK